MTMAGKKKAQLSKPSHPLLFPTCVSGGPLQTRPLTEENSKPCRKKYCIPPENKDHCRYGELTTDAAEWHEMWFSGRVEQETGLSFKNHSPLVPCSPRGPPLLFSRDKSWFHIHGDKPEPVKGKEGLCDLRASITLHQTRSRAPRSKTHRLTGASLETLWTHGGPPAPWWCTAGHRKY